MSYEKIKEIFDQIADEEFPDETVLEYINFYGKPLVNYRNEDGRGLSDFIESKEILESCMKIGEDKFFGFTRRGWRVSLLSPKLNYGFYDDEKEELNSIFEKILKGEISTKMALKYINLHGKNLVNWTGENKLHMGFYPLDKEIHLACIHYGGKNFVNYVNDNDEHMGFCEHVSGAVMAECMEVGKQGFLNQRNKNGEVVPLRGVEFARITQ